MHLFVVLNLVPLLIRVDLFHFPDGIWKHFNDGLVNSKGRLVH